MDLHVNDNKKNIYIYHMNSRRDFSSKLALYGRDGIDNPTLIDSYSFLHASAGAFAYIITTKYLGLTSKDGFIIFNSIHLLYEIKDWYYTYITKSHEKPNRGGRLGTMQWVSRSLPNSISDLIFGIAGYLLMAKYYDNIGTTGIVSIHAFMLTYVILNMVVVYNAGFRRRPPRT